MKNPRLKRILLPDGRRVFCVQRDEVRGVRAQAQGYLAHGIEIGRDDVVFDVGANIGLFTLEAAQKGARVHAFEPMPATFAALCANAREFGDGKICAHPLALGARSETATFTYFRYLSALSTRFPAEIRRNARIGIESFMDNPRLMPRGGWFRRAPQWLRALFVGALTRVMFISTTVSCKVEPLSAQLDKLGISRLDLLKIDVEGAEMEVLQGIEARDWPKIAQVVAEVHDENGRLDAMRQLLQGHGLNQIWTEKEPDAGQFEIYLLWARR